MYTGILMNIEEVNRNGYSYDRDSFMKVISDIHNNNGITIKGEYKPTYLQDVCQISIKNICVEFTKIWIEDNLILVNFNCIGRKGDLLQSDLDNKENVYFGLRCIADCNNKDKIINIAKIIAIDVLDINPRDTIYEYKKTEEL